MTLKSHPGFRTVNKRKSVKLTLLVSTSADTTMDKQATSLLTPWLLLRRTIYHFHGIAFTALISFT